MTDRLVTWDAQDVDASTHIATFRARVGSGEIRPVDGGEGWKGSCPRCGHQTVFELRRGKASTVVPVKSDPLRLTSDMSRSHSGDLFPTVGDLSLPDVYRCDCGFDHPGHPPGGVGCGFTIVKSGAARTG